MSYEPNKKKTERELHERIWGVPPSDIAGSDRADKSRAPRARQRNLYRMPPLEQAAESSSQMAGEDVRHVELRESIQKTAAKLQIDEIRKTLSDPGESQATIARRPPRAPRQPRQQSVKPSSERRLISAELSRKLLLLVAVPLLVGVGATYSTAYFELGSIPASSGAGGALVQVLVLNGHAITWVNLMFGIGSMFVAAGIGLALSRRRVRAKSNL